MMLIDVAIIVLLLSLALVLLLVEIFLLPGITIAGLGGLLCATGGVVYAYAEVGVVTGNISLGIALIVFSSLFYWLMRSNTIDKYALQTNIDGKVSSNKDLNIQSGDEGVTLSRLNPMGKIKVNGTITEGTSITGFISEATVIRVVSVSAGAVLVEAIDNN
jgi:membrane-bound ClpP family serine protease